MRLRVFVIQRLPLNPAPPHTLHPEVLSRLLLTCHLTTGVKRNTKGHTIYEEGR